MTLERLLEVCENAEGLWAPFHPSTPEELREWCCIFTPSSVKEMLLALKAAKAMRDEWVDQEWKYKGWEEHPAASPIVAFDNAIRSALEDA